MSSSERKPDTSTLLGVVLQWRPDLLLCRSRREPSMRRRNYGFDRRRREDLRRAKQEAKTQRKTDREASGSVGPEMGEAQTTGAPEGMWEWFSASRARTLATPPRTRPPADPPDDWILLTEASEEEAAPEA